MSGRRCVLFFKENIERRDALTAINHQEELEQLLKTYADGPLVRGGKHYKQRLKNGATIILSSTPSDKNYYKITLQNVRRALGFTYAGGAAGERKERHLKHGPAPQRVEFNNPPVVNPPPAPLVYVAPRNVKVRGAAKPHHRLERHAVAPVLYYSPEVIAHLNHLRETEGEAGVQRYLNELKQGTNKKETNVMSEPATSTTGLQEDSQQPKQVVLGTMETALREAEEKLAHHKRGVLHHQSEVVRWTGIVTDLKSLIQRATGKAHAAAPVNGAVVVDKKERGYWSKLVKELLIKEGNSAPLPLSTLLAMLREREPGCTFLNAMLKREQVAGRIVINKGIVQLPEEKAQ